MKRRPTGPTQETRQLVLSRARYTCEICGASNASNIHHRRPRGLGGTRDPEINSPANLLAVCGSGTTGCHGQVEAYRKIAYELGWLVRWGQDPVWVPFMGPGDTWWYLDREGGKHPAPTPG